MRYVIRGHHLFGEDGTVIKLDRETILLLDL